MDFQDYFLPAFEHLPYHPWQIGNYIEKNLPMSPSIVLIFFSENEKSASTFSSLRKEIYTLSADEWQIPMVDPGNLVRGRNEQESLLILSEVISFCQNFGHFPILLSENESLLEAQISTTENIDKRLSWTHICPAIHWNIDNRDRKDSFAIQKTLSRQSLALNQFCILGYQKHLNNHQVYEVMKSTGYDILRLSDLMGEDIHQAEPLLRMSNIISVDCAAVASPGGGFSIPSSINGFSSREICILMRDAGLSLKNKSIGFYKFHLSSTLDYQLLSQMIWYYIEGLNIRISHPKDQNIESYSVLIDQEEYRFHRETFSNRWYFGREKDLSKCIACSYEDFKNTKRGELPERLQRYI